MNPVTIIITVNVLALIVGAMCFYLGVLSSMYDTTKPGQIKEIRHRIFRKTFFIISYSRSIEGRGLLYIGFNKIR